MRFLLVDGVAAGLWERKKRGRRLEVTVEPAKALRRTARRALEGEAQRFADFLALEPALDVARRGR